MKNLILSLIAVSFLSFQGCSDIKSVFTGSTAATTVAATSTANDQVVVTAEKTLRISKDTFDLFLHLEFDNREAFARVSPSIHTFAENLRRNAPTWLSTANTIKNAYKHNRSTDNKASLLTALATLSSATTQAQKYITQINQP